jgi:hypothetical protein
MENVETKNEKRNTYKQKKVDNYINNQQKMFLKNGLAKKIKCKWK